jgi:predicted MFS family arabinose efflux permease
MFVLISRLQIGSLGKVVVPLGMARIALAPVALGHCTMATAALLTVWGQIGMPTPGGWGTWLSKALPQDAEASSGLMVATV